MYFPNLDWVGHEKVFVRLDGLWNFYLHPTEWVTKLIGKFFDLPPAHPSSYFMTSP